MKQEQLIPGNKVWIRDSHNDNYESVIRDIQGRIVANLEIDRHNITDEEIRANAYLISAAPDMESALKELIELKILKDYLKATLTHFRTAKETQLINEYQIREPLAWEAAKAALSKANPTTE